MRGKIIESVMNTCFNAPHFINSMLQTAVCAPFIFKFSVITHFIDVPVISHSHIAIIIL